MNNFKATVTIHVCKSIAWFLLLRDGKFIAWSQNSPENICTRVSFVMKLQASFLIKGLRYRCFPGNFENFLRGRFCKTPLDNCFCFYTIYLEQKNCSYMVINSSVTEGAVFYQCSAITDSRKLQKRLGRLIKGWRHGLTSSHPKSLPKKKKKKVKIINCRHFRILCNSV